MLISPDDAPQEDHSQAGMLPHCARHTEDQVESKMANWDNRGFSSHAQDGRKYANFVWTKVKVVGYFK